MTSFCFFSCLVDRSPLKDIIGLKKKVVHERSGKENMIQTYTSSRTVLRHPMKPCLITCVCVCSPKKSNGTGSDPVSGERRPEQVRLNRGREIESRYGKSNRVNRLLSSDLSFFRLTCHLNFFSFSFINCFKGPAKPSHVKSINYFENIIFHTDIAI